MKKSLAAHKDSRGGSRQSIYYWLWVRLRGQEVLTARPEQTVFNGSLVSVHNSPDKAGIYVLDVYGEPDWANSPRY
jgi:hypothetical protein